MSPWRILFLLSLSIYLLLGGYQLDLPGLNYDEALDAVPAMQFLQGQPPEMAATLPLGEREWPLMVMPYIGATSTYLYMAAFALKGVSVLALRQANLLLGLLTLCLIAGFLRQLFDARVAALTTLLLALDPTYLFWTRMGAYISLPLVPLAVGMLWALLAWYRSGRERYLLLAAFLAGLGLATKILFLWLLAALALAWLLLSPHLAPGAGTWPWLWPLRLSSWPGWLRAAGSFLLGTSMFLLYNLLYGFPTLQLILRNAGQTELYGVNNLDLPRNLRIVFFEDLRVMLDGSWVGEVVGSPAHNALVVPALLAGIAFLLLLAWRRRLPYSPHRVMLYLLLLVAITAQSAITITSLGAMHLAILWPIPHTLLVLALLALWPRQRALAALLLLLLLGASSWTSWQHHRALARTGGVDYHSDAINALAHDLAEAGYESPVALDWGFRRNLQLLTRGQVAPEERYVFAADLSGAYVEYINWRVSQAPTLYLFHAPEHTAFPGHWEPFAEAAYRHRLTPRLWKRYPQRNGDDLFLVYELEPAPARFAPPPLEHPLDAQLGAEIALLGYELPHDTLAAGERLHLTLYWQAHVPPTRSYKVFAHLYDAQGQVVAQVDSIPMSWGYPTTEWQAGEVVEDRLQLPLAPELAPGRYQLFIGMYDAESGARLPLALDGVSQPGDTLALTPIMVRGTP